MFTESTVFVAFHLSAFLNPRDRISRTGWGVRNLNYLDVKLRRRMMFKK